MLAVGLRLQSVDMEYFLNISALALVSISIRMSKFLRILTPQIARGLLKSGLSILASLLSQRVGVLLHVCQIWVPSKYVAVRTSSNLFRNGTEPAELVLVVLVCSLGWTSSLYKVRIAVLPSTSKNRTEPNFGNPSKCFSFLSLIVRPTRLEAVMIIFNHDICTSL